jgi:hypothetical protein
MWLLIERRSAGPSRRQLPTVAGEVVERQSEADLDVRLTAAGLAPTIAMILFSTLGGGVGGSTTRPIALSRP